MTHSKFSSPELQAIFLEDLLGEEGTSKKDPPTYNIVFRKKIKVSTDPQRRCYDGVNFSSEVVWTSWSALESGWAEERIEDRLKFWRDLNAYAVSERGELGTLCEFRADPIGAV